MATDTVRQHLKDMTWVDQPEVLPWYVKDLTDLQPTTKELFETYSKVPPDEVVSHITQIRNKAFKIFPYPCLGHWGFLNLNIQKSNAYDEVVQRIKDGEQYLDVGCCLGQDIRKLVYDGAPSENLYASDLKGQFWDIGYEMFLDKSSLKATFVEADILDSKSAVQQLTGKLDIVHAASFFHLFDWNDQIAAAKVIVGLLNTSSSNLILGRQIGRVEAGNFTVQIEQQNKTRYWHNLESWTRLWKQVGDETGTKWKVEAYFDDNSDSSQLINIHTAFHAGAYQQVLDFDTSSFSSSNALPVRVLKARSQIALGQAQAVSSELASEKTPDLIAVKLLADLEQGKDVTDAAKKLAAQHGQDNLTVQVIGGIILERAGETEEALALLSKHQGSLDAVALIVQIHLQQNRADLAAKEAQRARKWAQDSLLVNIAESWVGMREGGEKYQSAFYVFEELAQTSQSQSPHSLVAQAVSELHLGRLPEAEAALQQAIEIDPKSADTIANLIVLNTLLGKQGETSQLKQQLESMNAEHRAVKDWAEKKSDFQKAAAKYTPKFEVAA
ncbi:hypothetical protein OPT61_g7 [Boeremia exigua]|uniref:Uncharacterized protein n=1 Tax=Boeremia exigua TaxID=749465 RepID=A0ACC2IV78_9PLEO|nr:hypothetical protein OPT61_g7 [Boeremia exigua]